MSYYPKGDYNVFNFDINKAKELIVETCENRFQGFAEERVKQVIRSLIEYLNHPANVDETEYIHTFDVFFAKDSSFYDYIKLALEQKGFKLELYDTTPISLMPDPMKRRYKTIRVFGWAS